MSGQGAHVTRCPHLNLRVARSRKVQPLTQEDAKTTRTVQTWRDILGK